VATERDETPGALEDLRVLELADAKGEYCGKLLADMGADVMKVEAPGGDSTRKLPPFWTNESGERLSLEFLYMNANKRSVELDFDVAADRERFAQLARTVDVVLETRRPGELDRVGLGYEQLSSSNPGLVVTSITDFGVTGPKRDFHGSDLVAGALSGALYVTGDLDDPPVTGAANPAYISASACAAAATLVALCHRSVTGRGQRVDISAVEAMAATSSICGIGRFREDGVVASRYGTGLFAAIPSGAYRCRDGLAYLIVNRPAHWAALAKWIHETTGNEEVLAPIFDGPSSVRQPYRELLDVFIGELAAAYTVAAFYHEAQRRHIAITPVNTASDLYADPHLEARGFFVDAEQPGGGTLRVPGAPVRFEKGGWRWRRPAPRSGEHTDEVLSETRASRAQSGADSQTPPEDGGRGALAGIRVVEFTAGMAGPWIGRFMAACGADVVRVESVAHPDVTRLFVPPRDAAAGIQPQLSPWFTDWNAGKRFVSLDLLKPEGVALAKRIVRQADVVIDNYSTGTMAKLGLGADVLRADHPELVTFSSTGYGQTGPCRKYVTWGPNIEALSSLSTLSGFPNRECTITQFAYPDPISALQGLIAILCALRVRQRSGRGQALEMSQLEATAATLGARLTEYAATGEEPARRGNSSPMSAPHGVYRCKGEDRWCAITVDEQKRWPAFCDALGRRDLVADARFASLEVRLENRQALDAEVASSTRERDAYDVMVAMQHAGIAAGVVQNVEDQAERDDHLAARGFFERIPHAVRGEVVATGIPLGLTETPARTTEAGAAIGAHNREVLCGLCGLSEDEFARLAASGAITDQDDFLAAVRASTKKS
jgi:crotonobetainyl-CoA:carnitine CoA-transferase CaiB-like acyl-CoA transferase